MELGPLAAGRLLAVAVAVALAGLLAGQAAGQDAAHSLFPELSAYRAQQVYGGPALPCDEAYRRKQQPSSTMLGMQAWDSMQELQSLPARVAIVEMLHKQLCGDTNGSAARVRMASYTMWSGSMWGLRRTVLPSLQWGLHTGICRFYLLYPGRDAAVVEQLRKVACVEVLFVRRPFAAPEVQRDWQLWQMSGDKKPGTFYWMAMQEFGAKYAIAAARDAGYQWLLHIDADEVLLPGGDLAGELLAVPSWVASITFPNHEAQPEAVDVVNKYEQVTLFKVNAALAPPYAADLAEQFRFGDQLLPPWLLYNNGKSAVRVDGPAVQAWGVHQFAGQNSKRWAHPVHNPQGQYQGVTSSSSVVLHYAATSWQDLVAKAQRACPKRFQAAAAASSDPLAVLRPCFIFESDLVAYAEAQRGQQAAQRFWAANVLLSEGLYVRPRRGQDECHVFPRTAWLREQLVRAGVLMRVVAVRHTLRAHELLVRRVAADMGVEVPPLLAA